METARLKNRKSPLENRLFMFKSRPRGYFGIWHLLKLHYENGHKKPRSLMASGFLGLASILDAQYVLYRQFRCHHGKVNKIKGFDILEAVSCAT